MPQYQLPQIQTPWPGCHFLFPYPHHLTQFFSTVTSLYHVLVEITYFLSPIQFQCDKCFNGLSVKSESIYPLLINCMSFTSKSHSSLISSMKFPYMEPNSFSKYSLCNSPTASYSKWSLNFSSSFSYSQNQKEWRT